ncbi:hypothetical protein [Rhizobium sp. BG4]|uniref:hypothetical protein n=1 Tax=Rhizobium sp. BG4 TaxID=2613770 RepID=UPI00193DE706|nr:hypothetical protein [Rhizobium sp. BG4]QRM44636.1 hypothetical protein F2982_15010 [Rhizobium sp. BG4]
MIRTIFIAMVILLTTLVSAKACFSSGDAPQQARYEASLETNGAAAVDLSIGHAHDNHHFVDKALQSALMGLLSVIYVGHYSGSVLSLSGQRLAPADRPPISGRVSILTQSPNVFQQAVPLVIA